MFALLMLLVSVLVLRSEWMAQAAHHVQHLMAEEEHETKRQETFARIEEANRPEPAAKAAEK